MRIRHDFDERGTPPLVHSASSPPHTSTHLYSPVWPAPMAAFRCVVIACIASKAAALRPLPAQRAPHGHCKRSRRSVAQVQDLPAGWTTVIDPASRATYYCHESTGECQWEPPLQQDDQAETAVHDLPAGWTMGIDQESGTYYYNEQTSQSQWELPQQQGGLFSGHLKIKITKKTEFRNH